VSVVGLGFNTFGRFVDAAGAARVVHAALDLGVNFFDTADTYGPRTSEEYVGSALVDRRERASVRRWKADRIDLLQLHVLDDKTPLAETMRALDDLVRQGKVRYIGCSNFAARQVEDELLPAAQALGIGVIPPFPLATGVLAASIRRRARRGGNPRPRLGALRAGVHDAAQLRDRAAHRAMGTGPRTHARRARDRTAHRPSRGVEC
jgi:aryl-alcohol dehydrogenase-like predicted oxidoreductase